METEQLPFEVVVQRFDDFTPMLFDILHAIEAADRARLRFGPQAPMGIREIEARKLYAKLTEFEDRLHKLLHP